MRGQAVVGLLWLLSNVWLGGAMFFRPGWRLRRTDEVSLSANEALDPRYGPFHFGQRINHSDPNTRTFRQRYWANSDWYQEGGPVILYNAGELAADWRSKYVVNSSMALLARELKGAVVVVEHRSYGESQPGSDWSVKYLRTLNTEQALADMAYFIQNAKLPNLAHIPPAPETKWIVYGGSYSGNLAAWMRYKYPDLVFAAVPSSAPVEMKYNFYEYFNAIKQYAPSHCVGAVEKVVAYVDHILFSFFAEPKRKLKEKFGLGELEHDDDFAELLTYPLGLWQEMQPDKNPFVTEFCSIFDGKVTLHEQVDAYAEYIANKVQEACKDSPSITACLDTHDPRSPMYTDLKSENRPWFWQVCTEYAYWQTAAPLWQTSVVSRKLTTHWYQHQCPYMFGEHEVPRWPEWRRINEEYKGWYLRLTRTFWIDGEWDPWRTLSVQSDNAPDRYSWNDDAEFVVLPESVHHWDFFDSEFVSQDIKTTQYRLLATLRKWLNEGTEQAPYVRYQNP